MAYGVAQRSREFGIRLALGATRSDVTGMVLRQGTAMALVGTAIGLVGAALLSGVMQSLLFGVTSRDAASFAAAAGVLVAVAAVASYVPARRAASVDPVSALRL